MASKYIGIEDAADQLSMTVEQLNKLRESGDLRGFADRGTWKFKIDDIEKFARERQADSDPEVPILSGDSSPLIMNDDSLTDSDNFAFGEGLGDQPTEIRKKSEIKDDQSDSDVNLVSNDDSLEPVNIELGGASGFDSDSDVNLVSDSDPINIDMDGKDSDVSLEDSGKTKKPDSDSDVRLVKGATVADDPGIESDSDIALVDSSVSMVVKKEDRKSDDLSGTDPDQDELVADIKSSDDTRSGSDSDVRLLSDSTTRSSGSFEIDSDISLNDPGSDSEITLVPEGAISDSDVRLVPDSDVSLAQDSGISLSLDPDSGLTLGFDDDSAPAVLGSNSGSGMGLDNPNSGLVAGSDLNVNSGLGGDSGISLAADSGISLELAADSGISLGGGDEDDSSAMNLGGESGISLEPFGESGLTLAEDDDIDQAGGATVPMMDAIRDATIDHDENDTHVEFDVEEETFDLAMDDDEDDSAYELTSKEDDATNVIMFDDDDDDIDDDGDFIRKTEEEESVFDLDATDDDEFDMEDDVLGEDDELDDLDVFDADEDDLGDGFESGESQPEFIAPVRTTGAPAAPPWSMLDVGLVSLSTIAMIACSLIMVELVNSMWSFNQPFAPSNMLLDTVGGFFKS